MDSRLDRVPQRKADFVEPMECVLASKLPDDSHWAYEIKLDGKFFFIT
jgi:hypothetical protein